ncbi:MAG TPA: hypothetical protein VLL54_12560 [Pyrinomonadaceae bacterium]|nr:hypothetical protein [Pyrinomonadaceae bacterium]
MTDEKEPDSKKPDEGETKNKNGEKPSPLEPEVLEKLPPEVRKVVESFSLQAFSAGPMTNPVLGKVTEGHIDKVLDQGEKDSDREFQDRRSTRKYNLLYALIAAALFVFVTIYLAGQDKELYRDLLTKIIIFFGGTGAGYGIKAFRDRGDS